MSKGWREEQYLLKGQGGLSSWTRPCKDFKNKAMEEEKRMSVVVVVVVLAETNMMEGWGVCPIIK